MPIFTQPIHEAPLREFNDCHNPPGPGGGRFCSKTGAGSGPTPLMMAADRERYEALRSRWASVNDKLLQVVDEPDSPEARAHLAECQEIVKQIYRLRADPGGLPGIGLPGGPRDVVVIGAGPGGLAAAIVAGTDGYDTLVVDANTRVGGQAKLSSRVENYPGFPMGMSGSTLAQRMQQQAARLGAEEKFGVRVETITYDPQTELKTLTLSNGETIEARSVILAGGIEMRTLKPFPGSESPQVAYSEDFVNRVAQEGRGKPVVIIGGANSAAQAALAAARTSSHVTVLSRSAVATSMDAKEITALRNHPRITLIEGDEIGSMVTENGRTTLTTKRGRVMPTSLVGVFIGGMPATRWLPPGIKLADDGRVAVDGKLRTSMPGVFAVGDIRQDSAGRIVTATADGAIAVKNIFDYFRTRKSQE